MCVQCHIVVLNTGDTAFVFIGIEFFSLVLFHRLVQGNIQACMNRCWNSQVCTVKCLNHETATTGILQMLVLSLEHIAFSIGLHYRYFKYFIKFTLSSTSANILRFSPIKRKNKRKNGTRRQGQLRRVILNSLIVHAFVSLKWLWYSNWQIMTSLAFKQIMPGKWTETWYTESNLSY